MQSMRAADRIMDEAKALEFLVSAKVGRIAFSMKDHPYIVPMNYVYWSGNIYVHCADVGKKLDIVRSNTKVCFEVDEFVATLEGPGSCSYDTAYKSVIVFGDISILVEPQERHAALQALVEKYAGERMAAQLTTGMTEGYVSAEGSKTIILKIIPTEITGKQSV